MKNHFKTLVNMFKAVVGYTMDAANIAITQTVEAWLDLNEALQSRIASINSLVQAQAQQLNGYAAHKKALKDSACQLVYAIIRPTLSFARATNNEVLAAKMNLSLTDLRETDDSVFGQIMSDLIAAANAYITSLGPYSVTAAMITAAANAVTAYNNFQATPRNKVGERKAITRALDEMVTDTNNLIREQMDPLSVAFKNEIHMQYFESYLAMRKHVPVHNGTTKVRVLVIDGETEQPVPLAVTSVDETEATAITDIEGKSVMNTVPRGIRRVTVACDNYTTVQSPYFSLIQGDYYDLTVKMYRQFDVPPVTSTPEETPQEASNNTGNK